LFWVRNMFFLPAGYWPLSIPTGPFEFGGAPFEIFCDLSATEPTHLPFHFLILAHGR
jgi:hypothetical protein